MTLAVSSPPRSRDRDWYRISPDSLALSLTIDFSRFGSDELRTSLSFEMAVEMNVSRVVAAVASSNDDADELGAVLLLLLLLLLVAAADAEEWEEDDGLCDPDWRITWATLSYSQH